MSDSNNRTILHIALCLGLLFSAASYADPYHYENMLIGDRASGMGGAYTAIADDPSGLYYNPAGTVYVQGSSVSGSMNAFHQTYTEYADVFGRGKSWKRRSSALIPNHFGIVQPLGKGMLGFSYAVTDSVQEDQDQVFRNLSFATVDGGTLQVDSYHINFNNQDVTYRIGPSYALALNDDFSVGLTLYGYYRKQELILNQQVYYQDGRSLWTNQYFEIDETGFEPVLGLTWSPLPKLSLGLTLRQVMIQNSSARSQVTEYLSTDASILEPAVGTTSQQRDLPLNTRLGAAWFANEKLILSADISYFEQTDTRIAVTNFAFGSEYYLQRTIAARLGMFTNYANTAEVQQNGSGQLEHVDLTGLSASLSNFTRNTSITLGAAYSRGTGSTQVFTGSSAIQDVSASTFTLFLSAVYSY